MLFTQERVMMLRTDIEQENILRALEGKDLVKACAQCVHYRRKNSTHYCYRDIKERFNNVTGETKKNGEEFRCEHEREINIKLPSLVATGGICGAIGQFWEFNDRPIELKWYQKLGFLK